MGDLTVTAAQVAAVFPEKAEIYSGIAGVTITAGQAVYIIASSGKLGLADENASAEASAVIGIALNGGGAGQAIDVLRRGHVYGFTLTSEDYGEMVSLSATAGALLDTGATTSVVGRVEALADADLTKVLYVDCSLGVLSAFA
jgi:hypothetical protein